MSNLEMLTKAYEENFFKHNSGDRFVALREVQLSYLRLNLLSRPEELTARSGSNGKAKKKR